MGKPQAQGKGRSVCDESIAHCPALFLLLAAELLEKCSIDNCFNGKDQNLKQDIAEGKGQCARIIVDDIEGKMQRHRSNYANIELCNKIDTEIMETLTEKDQEHMVAVVCAWQQRVYQH